MCSFTVFGGPKPSVCGVDHHLPHAVATHLLHIELIRLLIVACEMLVHSSSNAVRSCWILAGTGTCCRIRRSRASQTCSWVTCPVSILALQELGLFSASRNCVQILQHGVIHYHAATWCDGHGWMAQQWASGSRHGISVHSKCHQKNAAVFIVHNIMPAHTITHRYLSCTENTEILSVKGTSLQSSRRHRMWAFSHSSRLRRRTAVRLRPRWGWRACRWASLRWFLTVSAEIIGYANRLLQQLSGWLVSDDPGGEDAGCGGPGAGVVPRGLRLWGRLDVLPNSSEMLWRWLMVEYKLTFNSWATALVDIPESACQLHHSLKSLCNICGLYCCKTAHFRVAFIVQFS